MVYLVVVIVKLLPRFIPYLVPSSMLRPKIRCMANPEQAKSKEYESEITMEKNLQQSSGRSDQLQRFNGV